MPTVAVLDEQGLLRGVEKVAAKRAAGRVEVPDGIDLPMDGSYWWDPEAKAFLALTQLAALVPATAPVPPDYAVFLALRSLIRGQPLPDEVRIYVDWYESAEGAADEPHKRSPRLRAVAEALRALVQGKPMPLVVRDYVEWYDRHERPRAERRVGPVKRAIRTPR